MKSSNLIITCLNFNFNLTIKLLYKDYTHLHAVLWERVDVFAYVK